MKKLLEAIQVEGAAHIGTAKGYDLFDILTFDAAQAFNVEDRNDHAGSAYVQNASTFNNNINENQHLYFFVKENTNQVFGAAVKSDRTGANVRIYAEDSDSIHVDIRVNFDFENAVHQDKSIRGTLPLFLIPNATFNEVDELGRYIVDSKLFAVLPQCTSENRIELLDLSDVTKIADNAFAYGMPIQAILLNQHTQVLTSNTFNGLEAQGGYDTEIRVSYFEEEAPATWRDGWDTDKVIVWGYGRSPEEIAQHETQLQAERERREHEEEERRLEQERQARLAAEREARKLRYKIVGKEVTIKGTVDGIDNLTIPETIQDLPVTKIESYAFYDMDDLKYVTVPSTLKIIEKGAFAHCLHLRRISNVPQDCIISKNVTDGSPYAQIYKAPRAY